MFLKTLRIFIIVKSGIRKIRIGPSHVLVLMFIFYFFWVLYLTVYTIVDPPVMVIAYAEDRLTGQFTETRSCKKGIYRFDLFLVILEAGIIIATAVLCFFTREVPDAINESKAIATGKYICFLYVRVIFRCTYSLNYMRNLFVHYIYI